MTAGGEVFVARTDYFSCFGRLDFFALDCPAPLTGKQAEITDNSKLCVFIELRGFKIVHHKHLARHRISVSSYDM